MKLLLNPQTASQIEQVLSHPRGSILLNGPAGTGKHTVAIEAARRLTCLGCEDESCRSCRMAAARTHPDIFQIEPNEKGRIGIESIQELQQPLKFSSYNQGRRVIIVKNADAMTVPAQNALLKTLEEPPESTFIILTAESVSALLETIVSRCRNIFFGPLPESEISAFLSQNHAVKPALAAKVAGLSAGKIGRAVTFSRDESALNESVAQRNLSAGIFQPNLFDRLQAAALLAKESSSLYENLEVIQSMVRSRVRSNRAAATNLVAIEKLRQRIAANINPKTALEAFAVEVEC
jgi:DNA polymerase III delta' subunit